MGLVLVDELRIGRGRDGAPHLLPKFGLNWPLAQPIVTALRELPGEGEVLEFILDVVQSFGRLSEENVGESMDEDATWGSDAVEIGQVIDLGEWRSARETATSRATDRIQGLSRDKASPAEIIDMYVSHIVSRVGHE
jgi:hypothetical protein